MQTPTTDRIPRPLLALARDIAERLAEAGHRGWIVGGTVRDLALGRGAGDVDMASAATPEVIEELWPTSIGVGRAFGTMIVHDGRGSIEVTTFRSERGYSDGRRPDEVRYGATLEEDAQRRDFTCNALYLDPLDGELNDPTGGLADLRSGILRAVGDPRERLAEDALRLLRLVRFHGQLGLEPTPELVRAARQEAPGLRAIAAERVLHELTRMFERPGTQAALSLAAELGLLGARFASWAAGGELVDRRRRALERLGDAPGVTAGLATLLLGVDGGGVEELEALRPSRELRRGVAHLWSWRRELSSGELERAPALRWLRELDDSTALGFGRALEGFGSIERGWRESLEQLVRSVPSEARRPAPLLSGADLIDAGVDPGPELGRLLRALEDEQLAGRVQDREAALAWLAEERGGARS